MSFQEKIIFTHCKSDFQGLTNIQMTIFLEFDFALMSNNKINLSELSPKTHASHLLTL